MTPVLAGALLIAALAIVGYGLIVSGGFAGRVARLAKRTSRRRMVLAWAAGTWVTYGLSALIALAILDRADAIATMPTELMVVAWRLGLPGRAEAADLAWLLTCLATGGAIGVAILAVRRWSGRAPIGLRYRSPAAARSADERLAATVLALAAGVGEELFFRLTLPLLFALALGWGVAGFAVSLAAFVALHRHQGAVGMVAVALTGAVLTGLYLLTGVLWIPILLHVAIDLNALVLRPWISGGMPVDARVTT